LGRRNNWGKNGGDFLLPQALLEIILGVVLGVAAHSGWLLLGGDRKYDEEGHTVHHAEKVEHGDLVDVRDMYHEVGVQNHEDLVDYLGTDLVAFDMVLSLDKVLLLG